MKRSIALAVAFVAALVVAMPAPSAGGRPLEADLSGEAEVPGPGDPDGSGSAHITLNRGRHEVCFVIEVADVAPITAAHIHEGAADVSGPVVVDFNVPVNGLNGCVDGIDGALIMDIQLDPSGYYVNVHNADFPPGALRGQLGLATGKPPQPPSSRPDHVPGNPLYLALGDSWAWGQGVAAGTEATAGYVGQLFTALQTELDCVPAASVQAADGCAQLQLLNLGRPGRDGLPGVTAPLVSAEQLPVAVPLLEARNGDDNPRNDVEVVTLHVGGNDVSGPIQAACLGGLDPGCIATWTTEMNQFEADLRSIVTSLRNAAGPDTRIVLGTYDNPVPYCRLFDLFGPPAVVLADAVLEGLAVDLGGGVVLTLDGLHPIIRDVAGDFDAEVAEVFGQFVQVDFVGGNDCLHPTESGYDKVTDAFLNALGL